MHQKIPYRRTTGNFIRYFIRSFAYSTRQFTCGPASSYYVVIALLRRHKNVQYAPLSIALTDIIINMIAERANYLLMQAHNDPNTAPLVVGDHSLSCGRP